MTEIVEWWNDCHKKPGSFYVSDYGGPTLWEAMRILNRIRLWKRVLEIGVGAGNDVRELYKRRCKVYALDITATALEKVKGLTKGEWLNPEALPDKFFDLAISHLVTQHIDNKTLEGQIRNVLRSLKRKGLFAMQFADQINGTTDETYNETLEYQQGGGVCRSPDMMRAVIEGSGGKIVWMSQPRDFVDFGSRWFYLHIVPATSIIRIRK